MALAGIDWTRADVNAERMAGHAREASELLKALAHEGRLMILCDLLAWGEVGRRTGGALVEAPGLGFPAVGAPPARGPRVRAPGRQNDLLRHRQ
jgi:hypothetical protein